MNEHTIKLDDLVAHEIRKLAKQSKLSDQEYLQLIVDSHVESLRCFPEGVIRAGCTKIIALLSQIPSLSQFEYGGVGFRHWWVSFEIDTSSPIAWSVIHKLGWSLNTQSVEMSLPVVFSPIPDESLAPRILWRIDSTAPLLDPEEVAVWLEENLPAPVSSQSAWLATRSTSDEDENGP